MKLTFEQKLDREISKAKHIRTWDIGSFWVMSLRELSEPVRNELLKVAKAPYNDWRFSHPLPSGRKIRVDFSWERYGSPAEIEITEAPQKKQKVEFGETLRDKLMQSAYN